MVLATAKVEDVDRFLATFSTKGAEKRMQYGSGGSHVFRDPNDDTRVWVVFDWDDEGYGKLLSDPTCRRFSRRPVSREGRSTRSLSGNTRFRAFTTGSSGCRCSDAGSLRFEGRLFPGIPNDDSEASALLSCFTASSVGS